jgi:hypothetical protein
LFPNKSATQKALPVINHNALPWTDRKLRIINLERDVFRGTVLIFTSETKPASDDLIVSRGSRFAGCIPQQIRV